MYNCDEEEIVKFQADFDEDFDNGGGASFKIFS